MTLRAPNGGTYELSTTPPRATMTDTSGIFYLDQKPGVLTPDQIAHEIVNAAEVIVDFIPPVLEIPVTNADGKTIFLSPNEAAKRITTAVRPDQVTQEAILSQLVQEAADNGYLNYRGKEIDPKTVLPGTEEATVLTKAKIAMAALIFPSYLSIQAVSDASEALGKKTFVCKSMVPSRRGEQPTRLSLFLGGKAPTLLVKAAERIAQIPNITPEQIKVQCDQLLAGATKEDREQIIDHTINVALQANAAGNPMSSFLSNLGSAAGETGSPLNEALIKASAFDRGISDAVNKAEVQISSAGVLDHGRRTFITAGTGQKNIKTAIAISNSERVFRTDVTPAETVAAIKAIISERQQSLDHQVNQTASLLRNQLKLDRFPPPNDEEILRNYSNFINLLDGVSIEVRQKIIANKLAQAITISAVEQAMIYISLRLARPDLTPSTLPTPNPKPL